MIKSEAAWIRHWLEALRPKTVLNIGSSTLHYRTVEQPWIAECFAGFNVIHVDKKVAEGVDVVCDLTDMKSFASFRAVYDLSDVLLASNLLEHVECREAVLENLRGLQAKVTIISVPHDWEHHPDPIDNGWRPTPKELTACVRSFHFRQVASCLLEDPRGSIAAGAFILD